MTDARRRLRQFSGPACGALLLLAPLCAAGPALSDLSDDPVRIELANDGLATLLQRAFIVDNIPPDRRGPEMAVIALQQLNDPNLSATDRQARLNQIVSGIGAALPEINDPHVLLSAAATLVHEGVERDVNTLEYFGEDGSDATKARLAPIVTVAVQLYDRAVKLLDQQQTDLQNQITKPNDPAAAEWQKVDQDFQTASYTRWMLAYSQALSMDRADRDRRQVCDTAIQSLGQWDNADSGVQPAVRLQMAKLLMLEGGHTELKQSKDMLGTLLVSPDSGGVTPAADRYMRFNAMYFSAVCDVIGRDADAADRDARMAEDYRQSALLGVSGDEYAMDMLHYRIALLRGDKDKAVKILENLGDQAPGLRAAIAGQLLDKLPANPDLSKLTPLMLSALVDRGWAQASRPHPDHTILDEGLAAARQYLARADQGDPAVTPTAAMDASKACGVILKAEGKTAQAASAFLDHVQRYQTDPSAQAGAALDEAIGQIALLYRGQGAGNHQSDIDSLEDRLFPLAVDSFRRYDLAYEYARRLQRTGQVAKAAQVFDLVPDDDPNALNAKFFKMVALNQRFYADPHDAVNSLSAADQPAVVQEILKLAHQVSDQAAQKQAAATDDAQKRDYQSLRVRTALLAAEVGAAHDPGQTLALLADFEQTVKGLPDAPSLIAQATNLRIAAYMAVGQTDKATHTLVSYLDTVGGNEGLQAVYALLTQLNSEMDRAQAAFDSARVRALADDRAALTPFLVKWAQSNPNPDISKFTYRYRVFDAATQRQAAELEPDAAARQSKLKDALARFQDLQSADNVKLYQASLPPDAPADVKDYPDPAVTLGLGGVAFDLGDWKLAHDTIGQLLADSKLGDATMVVKNAAGQDETVDNDQFWEAEYHFIAATAEMAKDSASGVDPQTPRTMIAQLQAVWQDRIGGKKWHGKFEELAKQLSAPATQQ